MRIRARTLTAALAVLAVAACSGTATPSAPAPGSAAPPGSAPASAGASEAPPSQAAVEGGTVTIRLPGDWGNPIDGHTVTSAYGIMLASMMYDTLLYLDPADGQLSPYLAETWEVTPTSVTVQLRDDATCSDGTPVTPTVVRDSFARFIAPETGSRWVQTTLGPGPFTLEADDAAGTFTITTEAPFAPLLTGLSDPRAAIVCPSGLQPGADFTKASHGSGAFVFESAVQGDEYVATRRDDWTWGPKGTTAGDPGFPERLVFKVITSDTTAANSLTTGGLDIANISGIDVDRLVNDPTVDHIQSEGGAPYVLMLNQAPTRPTADETVRRAVIQALDPRAWTVAAGEPEAPVSTNIHINPGGYCYTDLSSILPTPSVDAARQILLDAGYTADGEGKLAKDGQPLALRVLGTGFTGSGVEYIADTLEQVGVTVDLVNTDYNTFAQNFGKTDYDVVIGLFGGLTKSAPTSTPLFMVGTFASEGGNNRINLDDPELQRLVEAAYGAPTEEEACAAWEAFNRYAIENAITIPWASSVTHWFSRAGEFSYRPVSSYLQPTTIRRLK
jgi:peptide/nickel transport system substrate-binding protein